MEKKENNNQEVVSEKPKAKKKGMNLPNKLTILRAIMVPIFVACMIYIPDPIVCGFVASIVFIITATTDVLDGNIARKYGLITNFGKFMDPVADKFMVFAALLTMCARIEAIRGILIWTTAIVFFRELAVTSLRMICAGTEVGVVSASIFGKAKTLTQVIAIVAVLIEYAVIEGRILNTMWILSYVAMIAVIIMTVGSGLDYLKTYGKHINPEE